MSYTVSDSIDLAADILKSVVIPKLYENLYSSKDVVIHIADIYPTSRKADVFLSLLDIEIIPSEGKDEEHEQILVGYVFGKPPKYMKCNTRPFTLNLIARIYESGIQWDGEIEDNIERKESRNDFETRNESDISEDRRSKS